MSELAEVVSPLQAFAFLSAGLMAVALLVGFYELARALVSRPEPQALLKLGDWVRWRDVDFVQLRESPNLLPLPRKWTEGETMLIDFNRQEVMVAVPGEPVHRTLRVAHIERALCDSCPLELGPGEARRCSACSGVVLAKPKVRVTLGERYRRLCRRLGS